MPRRLAVLAGSGDLVPQVVEAALASGDKVQVFALTERAAVPGARTVSADIDNPLAIVLAIRLFRASHLVMAGGIHLSDRQRDGLAKVARDEGEASTTGSGDAALSALKPALKKLTGAELLGVHEVAPHLVAQKGLIAGPPPDAAALASARQAMAAARTIGRLDLGQAAVVAGTRVIAVEDVAGTDDLLRRVTSHRAAGLVGNGQGVLVLAKASKPQQPAEIDLPAIGPDTVDGARAAGISLIAVEPLRTLLIDRTELIRRATAAGITIFGLAPDA